MRSKTKRGSKGLCALLLSILLLTLIVPVSSDNSAPVRYTYLSADALF